MYAIALLGLFVVFVFPSCQGLTADVELSRQCIEEYKNVLANYNTEKGTCTRLQATIIAVRRRDVVERIIRGIHRVALKDSAGKFGMIFMDCLSKRRDLKSQMLDSMRHFFMQQAIFVHKLNFCPNIDFQDLKEITDQANFGKTHVSLENSKYNQESDKCAVDVHKTCVSFYTNLFSKEKKICDDVTSWINCYSQEAAAIGCNAEILKDFAKMLQSTGGLVIREIRRYVGSECLKMEL